MRQKSELKMQTSDRFDVVCKNSFVRKVFGHPDPWTTTDGGLDVNLGLWKLVLVARAVVGTAPCRRRRIWPN